MSGRIIRESLNIWELPNKYQKGNKKLQTGCFIFISITVFDLFLRCKGSFIGSRSGDFSLKFLIV